MVVQYQSSVKPYIASYFLYTVSTQRGVQPIQYHFKQNVYQLNQRLSHPI